MSKMSDTANKVSKVSELIKRMIKAKDTAGMNIQGLVWLIVFGV